MPKAQEKPSGGSSFQIAYPCQRCPDFMVVKFSRSKHRHMCGRSGAWLEASGVLPCVRRKGGSHDDAA